MKEKKKIGFLIGSFVYGGAEKMMTDIVIGANNTQTSPIVISFYSPQNTEMERRIESNNIPIIYLNKTRGFSFKILFSLPRIIKKYNIKMLHTQLTTLLYVIPLLFFIRISVIHTVHSEPYRELPKFTKPIISYVYKKNLVIPVGVSVKISSDIEKYYGIKENTVKTIYNPVDLKKFNCGNNYRSKGKFIFVNVASLRPEKNHELLINAFYRLYKEYDNVELIIAGDGFLRQELEDLVEKLKLQSCVKFIGIVDNIPELLCNSDAFVLSSKTEALPISIIEAMSCGLPIIAPCIGGIPELVIDNGILVNQDSIDSLLYAMVSFLKSDLSRYRINSLARSKKFDVYLIVKEYEQLYEKYYKYSKEN